MNIKTISRKQFQSSEPRQRASSEHRSNSYKIALAKVHPGKGCLLRVILNIPVIHQQSQDTFSLRKEVIQPQVLLRLPCYDFTPIMSHTLGPILLAVRFGTSSTTHFRDVTGGVYKARERIHGSMLICHY
jgi:hypothetical protein